MVSYQDLAQTQSTHSSKLMRWSVASLQIVYTSLASLACAQFPFPVSSDDLTVSTSPVDINVTISYKSPDIGTCTTVFHTQRQFTGYITLPPDPSRPSQGNYTVNTFFWFIEARQVPEAAPLTIFINGGPGSSSMVGLFQEVGPCQVVEVAEGLLGTVAREWGWDRSSNIVFIDQPVQVGFSYDQLTNASLNLLDESLQYPPTTVPITQPPYTFLNGTFSSDNPMSTANTSNIEAQSIWHFLQGFLATFPQYNPDARPEIPNSPPVGINLFTESYGGKYAPAIGAFFSEQNQRRDTDPNFANITLEITLKTLGIINGWIDLLVQTPYFPIFAYNNSYGIQAIDQLTQLNALSSFRGPGGCQELATSCRAQALALDPDSSGDDQTVNDACSAAQYFCQANVIAPYLASGRSIYDITQNQLDPFPDSHYLEYLNTASVQQSIGTPVNYTQDSLAVFFAFNRTGDWARDDVIRDLADLLNDGVRIALIYGDKDFVCNWISGEAVSFAIAGAAGPAYAPWYSAGYAPIVTNDTYIGGVVREFGNLSFSRIYDAGHLVPAYQPETAFTVYSRVIEGTDISLGNVADLSSYSSFGDANSTHSNVPPPAAPPKCFLRAVNNTCDTDQKNMLANRAGTVINGVLYNKAADWRAPGPSISSMAGVPGTAPSSMIPSAPPTTRMSSPPTGSGGRTSSLPTGVFTATGVPMTTTSSSAENEATRVADSNILGLGSLDTPKSLGMLVLGVMGYGVL
jgi:carboxypeptidase C (cathepsin A)